MKDFTIYYYKYFFMFYYFITSVLSIYYDYNMLMSIFITSLFIFEIILYFRIYNIIGARHPAGVFLVLLFIIIVDYLGKYSQYIYILAVFLYLFAISNYIKMYYFGLNIKNNKDKLIKNYELIQFNYETKEIKLIKNNITFIYDEKFEIYIVLCNKKYYNHLVLFSYIKNNNLILENLTPEDFNLLDIIQY